MMRQVGADCVAMWTPDTEIALRQCGQFAAYGTERPFLRFYVNDNSNRLSLFENAAFLDAHGDTEEMCLFLTMDPTVQTVRTDVETAAVLSRMWGVTMKSEAVMQAPSAADVHDLVSEMPLRDVYGVLLDGFGKETLPPFDVWYADVHHRYRRGLCRAVGVYEDGVAVACAMTVAECESAALIGAVATRPQARGKGYASACVLTLSAMLYKEQKRVLLSPKNEYAHRLYDRIGFKVVGEWGSVDKSE